MRLKTVPQAGQAHEAEKNYSPQRAIDDYRPRRDDPPGENERRDRKEVINTIAGGFAGGGGSNSA